MSDNESEKEKNHICFTDEEKKQLAEIGRETTIHGLGENAGKIQPFLEKAGDCVFCRRLVYKAVTGD